MPEMPSSQPVRIDPSVLNDLLDQYPMAVSVSPDGTELLVKTRQVDRFQIAVLNANTKRVLFSDTSDDTQLALTWRTDSRAVAYLAGQGGDQRFQLYLWLLGKGTPRAVLAPITHTAAPPIRWALDGDRLAYFSGTQTSQGSLVVINPTQGAAETVSDDVAANGDFQWSPDSTAIAATSFSSPGSLHLIDIRDHSSRQVEVIDRATIGQLAWDHTGTRLLVTARGRMNELYYSLFQIDLKHDTIHNCYTGDGDVMSPFSLPDGHVVFGVNHMGDTNLFIGSCGDRTIDALGFSGGTTRMLGTGPDAYSFYLLHSPPDRPPAIIEVASKGRPAAHILYEPPAGREIMSVAPRQISVRSSDGVTVPSLLWSPSGKVARGAALV